MRVIISFVIDICQAQTTTQYANADSPMICAYAAVGIGSYAEHVLLSEEEMQDERAGILSVLGCDLSKERQAAEAAQFHGHIIRLMPEYAPSVFRVTVTGALVRLRQNQP